jgi:SPOR domain
VLLTEMAIFLPQSAIMKQLVFVAMVLVSGSLAAQQTEAAAPKAADTSAPAPTVVVQKDPRIDELTNKKIAIKTGGGSTETIKVDRFGRVNMPGYRLQVLNTTDRTKAYQTKAMLYQKFPGHAVYVIAQAPFFKVRFGNFITKDDADKYRKMMSPMFPAGVSMVQEIIEAKINKSNPPKPKDKDKEKEDRR